MNYPSSQMRHYRIFVTNFDAVEGKYLGARIERVAFPPVGFPTCKAYDYRYNETIEISLFAMDFITYEVVPLFLLKRNDVSKLLDEHRLRVDRFEE